MIRRNAGASLPDAIRKVNGAMAHRGPDADGFWIEGDVAFGHRRLSIIDLSSAANQPFADASGRYQMVFNGEIYNFQELKSRITGYPFKTTSDTEVVIAGYAKWGPAFLSELKGMFAIAIWDREKRSLFMARDRFGVKPMYYYQDEQGLLFASEVRALLASGLVPGKINETALADYLRYQSCVAPYTLIKDVFQLPAGTYAIYENGQLRQTTWWDISKTPRDVDASALPVVHKRIKELLFASVERRLISDVPLGAFLSGGIDSSVIVAIMSQVSNTGTNAFTIGFEEEAYNELPYAELVAKKFGVRHDRILLKPSDFLDRLPAALDAVDSPSGDGLNTYVVSDAIRKSGITVALSGIGGDELFAGYPLFRQFYGLKQRAGLFDHSAGLRRVAAALLPASNQRSKRFKGILASPSSDISAIYPILREIQDPATISRLMNGHAAPGAHLASGTHAAASGPGMLATPADGRTLERQLRALQPDIGRFDPFSQVSIAEYLGYTQSVLLKDADQMGMAVSLEIREPFFDHDLVEYVLNVPDKYKFPTYPKKLLVESLGDLLPETIVHRKKQGFVLPYDLWMRNELREFCQERISNLAARGLFGERQLLHYWDQFIENKANIRWADIWIFVVLEHWLEKNGVG